MVTLYSEFVSHYTTASMRGTFRQHYSNSWIGISKNDEVEAVKQYLLGPSVGVAFLNSTVALGASNAKFILKFASIFCHKKPRVKPVGLPSPPVPNQTVGCELGDLFVMFVLMNGADEVLHARGALFQAKMTPKLDSPTQKFLYDSAGSMNVPSYLEERSESPGSVRQLPSYDEGRALGFRYLVLHPHPVSVPATPADVGVHFTPWESSYWTRWSTFMDGLLSGSTGLPADVNQPNSAWDHIVADLFEMVRFTASQNKAPRGNSVVAQILSSCFNNYGDRSHFSELLDEKREGIPTLVVIAHAPNLRGG